MPTRLRWTRVLVVVSAMAVKRLVIHVRREIGRTGGTHHIRRLHATEHFGRPLFIFNYVRGPSLYPNGDDNNRANAFRAWEIKTERCS